MKKLLLIAAFFTSGFLNAQAVYPLYQDFDGVATSGNPLTGPLPTNWTTSSGFKVYGNHGWSMPNACSTNMSSTHTKDTLYTPLIGPINGNTKLSLAYRFVNKALYPANGTQLAAGDQVTIDANIGGSWNNSVATIDVSTNPNPLSTYTTYTYTNALFSIISGQNIQLRMDVARATGDWYLDIDNFIVADNVVGISTNILATTALKVSPNPATENFTVSLKNYNSNHTLGLKLFNSMGQLIKTITPEKVINNEFNVNTTDLAKGMYIVEVTAGNEVSKTKVIIE